MGVRFSSAGDAFRWMAEAYEIIQEPRTPVMSDESGGGLYEDLVIQVLDVKRMAEATGGYKLLFQHYIGGENPNNLKEKARAKLFSSMTELTRALAQAGYLI